MLLELSVSCHESFPKFTQFQSSRPTQTLVNRFVVKMDSAKNANQMNQASS